MKLIYLFLFLLSFSFSRAQWLKEKGKGYYKLGTWSLLADQHFTDIGGVDPNATRGLFISSFFGHYGLSEKVNIIAYLTFFVKNYQFAQISDTRKDRVYEPRQEFNSLGDINIAAEVKILPLGNWAFSATLLFGLPTGKSVGGFDGSYQTGDGEFNQQLQFNFGKSIALENNLSI